MCLQSVVYVYLEIPKQCKSNLTIQNPSYTEPIYAITYGVQEDDDRDGSVEDDDDDDDDNDENEDDATQYQ